jgi:hypothetical protein
MLLATFLPNDGPESTLARLMIATTNAAMDCFARANSDASEVRDLELNYAVRLCLTAATLSRAFDHHRASKKEEFIDDTLPPQPRPKFRRRAHQKWPKLKQPIRSPIPLPNDGLRFSLHGSA